MDEELSLNEHIHQHGAPGYIKVLSAAVGALILFSAVVSGGIYGWSRDVFILAALALFVFCLPGPQKPVFKGIWPAFFLLAIAAVSTLWTINLNNTLEAAFTLSGFASFAYLSALAASGDRDTRRALLATFFAAAIVVSIYGIYQYFIGFAHTEEYLREVGAASGLSDGEVMRALYKLGGRRAFSTLLSPDVLACYLGMAFPVGLSLMSGSRRKAVYVFGLAAIFTAVVLTKSMGGLIAFFVGVLVFVATMVSRRGLFTKRSVLALCLVALVAAGSVFGVALARRSIDSGLKNSASQRAGYWSGALAIFKDSPALGQGAGSFEILYPAHIRPGADETRYAHNLILQTIAETGLIGLAAVFILFAGFWVCCLKALKKEDGVLMAGVMAGGAVFFVHNLVDYSFYVQETAAAFWFLLGLSAAEPGEEGYAHDPDLTRTKVIARTLARVLPAVAAITIGFFYIKACAARNSEAEAVKLLNSAGITSAAAARMTPAPVDVIKLAEKAVRLKPYDDRYRAFLAGLYEGRAVVDGPGAALKAETEYAEAIRLNPYYPFYYRDLGVLWLRLGDKGRARDNFQKALARYPASKNLQEYLELTGN